MVAVVVLGVRWTKGIFERHHWRRSHVIVSVLLLVRLLLLFFLLWEVERVFWLWRWKTRAERVCQMMLLLLWILTPCSIVIPVSAGLHQTALSDTLEAWIRPDPVHELFLALGWFEVEELTVEWNKMSPVPLTSCLIDSGSYQTSFLFSEKRVVKIHKLLMNLHFVILFLWIFCPILRL